MIEVVIKYDEAKKEYVIYESSTDTMMVSQNMTEALVLLNKFLKDSGLSNVDLLSNPDVSYHIDSQTMKSIVEGNVKLLKRLNSGPSSFQVSSQKFGASNNSSNNNQAASSNKKQRSSNSSSATFASATGFRNAYKKFGGYGSKF